MRRKYFLEVSRRDIVSGIANDVHQYSNAKAISVETGMSQGEINRAS
jgi:hypothetical protein